MSALDHLAYLAGIEPHYWDIWGNYYETSEETKRVILDALGIPAADDPAVEAGIAKIEQSPWTRIVPPVIVLREGAELHVPFSVPSDSLETERSVRVVEEEGTAHEIRFVPAHLPSEGVRNIDGKDIDRRWMHVQVPLPLGYHDLVVEGAESSPLRVIIAPHACDLPKKMAEGGKLWGITTHLYTLRSDRNWGIGDFTDLADLVDVAAKAGASAIGLNPLHALFTNHPEEASPYSPNSRVFLNPLFIDVEAVPDFAEWEEAQQLVSKLQSKLNTARQADIIKYRAIMALKSEVLEILHNWFRANHAKDGDARAADLEEFRALGGERLHRFTVFEALTEEFGSDPWQKWPADSRRPDTKKVRDFAAEKLQRLEYFEYLQWQADRQLAAARDRAHDTGLAIGLYQDLAIGADPKGADAWSDQEAVTQAGHVGAPPDPFNMLGQDWGMPPMHPVRLRDLAYEPFIATLRANMRHAGALRIDHAMGLKHLFWIPSGSSPAGGAYVEYPFEDLLGILALESHRNRCLVIGEDLGTVPEGFRERMAEMNILSYRVLYFEKMGDRFKGPGEYPPLALACVSTHDLPTLKGFWDGSDLALKRKLKLYPSKDAKAGDVNGRAADRSQLLHALNWEGLLPDGINPDDPDAVPMTAELAAAVHGYLARSPANLLMVQIDDLTEETDQINVPGTVHERPNWRRRLSMPVERLASSRLMKALAPALAERGPGA